MDKLKDFIDLNKEAFEEVEMPEGHFERFERKLERQGRRQPILLYGVGTIAAAAVVALLLLIGRPDKDIAPEPSEIVAQMCETREEFEETRKHLLVPYMYEKDEPLYHAGIYQTDSAKYLFLDIAHIVGDGMTLKILFEDLNDLYAGKPVEKEKYTLFEYVLDEKARDGKGKREQDIAYYRELMKGIRIRKSILTLRDFHDLERGENASLRGRFTISPRPLIIIVSAFSAMRRMWSARVSTADVRTAAGQGWRDRCS